jgi:hypothetical protein
MTRTDYADRLEKLAALHDLNPLTLLEAFLERAAIREFDGGFKREEAERLAMRDIEEQLQ